MPTEVQASGAAVRNKFGRAGPDKLGSALHAAMALPHVGLCANLLALASLVAFGITNAARLPDAVPFWDLHFLFAGGRMWAVGQNPYLLSDFIRYTDPIEGLAHSHLHRGFAYPPTIAPLCLLLGAVPLGTAIALLVVANALAIAVLALYSARLVCASLPEGKLRQSVGWAVPAIVIGNPFTAHVMHMGQTTLMAAAALVSGWHLSEVKGKHVLSGALFALATIKPQVAALCVLWIVAKARPRQLAVFGAGVVILSAVPLCSTGPVALARTWLAAMVDYEHGPIQRPGFQNVFGLQSALVASGISAPSFALVAMLVLALLIWQRKRLAPDEVLGLLLAATCLFVYAHDYDLAALAPLFGLLWRRSASSNRLAMVSVGTYALLFAPQRFVRYKNLGLLEHWRELVLFGVLLALVVELLAGRRERAPEVQASVP
jgi:hypothetical protein